MEREKLISYCKYYKGEEECPYDSNSGEAHFWYGERMWVFSDQIGHWTDYGRKVKAKLTGEKHERANQYTDLQFGIICYIELLFSSHCPFMDMSFIFNY